MNSNDADIRRAVKSAQHAQSRAETTEKSQDYDIAAGFYRNAAALWRLAENESNAIKCEAKADRLENR